VILPKELAKTLPKARLLSEQEWRGIGVQQSRGWGHYAIHRYELTFVILWFFIELFLNSPILFSSCRRPEPHILLFRRPLGTDPVSGKVDSELERQAKEEYLSNLNESIAK
jgi:cyclin-dependent kinase regulatory subunit CKS1